MAYQKIENYPSIKTKGVYPSGSIKQLGLNSDDLKKFSLGNWTSIMRGDVFFTFRETGQDEIVADERGRPVFISFDESRFEVGMSRIECTQNDNGQYSNFGEVERPDSGDSVVKMNNIGSVPNYEIVFQHDVIDGYIDGQENIGEAKTDRHLNFFKHYYSGNTVKDPTESEAESNSTPTNNDFNINVSFQNTEYKSNRTMGFQDFQAFIVEGSDVGENRIKVRFYSNDDGELISNPKGLIKKLSYTSFEMQDGVEDYFDNDNRNTEFYFPTFFFIKTAGSDVFSLGRLISFPEISGAQGLGNDFFVFDVVNTDITGNENFRLRLGYPNFEFNPQISSATPTVDEKLDFIVEVKTQDGDELIYHDRTEEKYLTTSYPVEVNLNMNLFEYPNFNNEVSDNDVSSYLSDLYYLPLDVNVNEFLEDFSYGVDESYFTYQIIQWGDENVLLSDDEIKNTFFFSLYDLDEYPSDDNYFLKKSIASQGQQAIGIENQINHVYNTPGVKSIKIIVYRYESTQSLLLQTYLVNKNIVINDGSLTSQDFQIFGGTDFTFLPLQNQLAPKYLTINQNFTAVQVGSPYENTSTGFDAQSINDIEGFNFYDYFSEFPDERDVFINGTPARIIGFLSVLDASGTPTITTLSISNNSWDGVFVEGETYSFFWNLSTNALISQPLYAIIGGFDKDSKYSKSVEKITKDDDFIAEDYLQRASSRDYIEKFNDSLLGKRPGQLDLGQTRLFNQPRDLYDFIGGDKLQWITNGSGSLPLNSSATDIFIKDDNCLVDLNPSNSEFSVLQNQVGLKEVGVLTGDYKLNQPKNSRVQKQGLMEVPLLDDNVDKQAF
tara:strand:- start:5153 stop:7654 length:2502 start_codon:yes stop_codon:yes gene_type:complete